MAEHDTDHTAPSPLRDGRFSVPQKGMSLLPALVEQGIKAQYLDYESPDYGLVHKCHLCGVEVSVVPRSFGRRSTVEIATGYNHRYSCAGHEAAVAAMLAKVMRPDRQWMPDPIMPQPPLMASKSMTFRDAITQLATETGVVLPAVQAKRIPQRRDRDSVVPLK